MYIFPWICTYYSRLNKIVERLEYITTIVFLFHFPFIPHLYLYSVPKFLKYLTDTIALPTSCHHNDIYILFSSLLNSCISHTTGYIVVTTSLPTSFISSSESMRKIVYFLFRLFYKMQKL